MEKSEKLKKLKEDIEKLFNKKLEEQENIELISKIDSLSFPCLVELFEATAPGIISCKEGTTIIGKYGREIKKNRNLRNAYKFIKGVLKENTAKDSNLYTDILAKGVIDNELTESNLKNLRNILKEAVKLDGTYSNNIKDIINNGGSVINESLSFVLENKPNLSNATKWSNSITAINETISKNKKELIKEEENGGKVDINETINELENLIKEGGSDIEKTIMSLLESKDETTLFEQVKKDCILKIEETMSERDGNDADRFKQIKENLERKVYNKETFLEDINRISEL